MQDKLPDNVRDVSEVVAIVRSEMVHMRGDVDKLMRITVDGNGHSLQSRMAVIESKMEDSDDRYDKNQSQTGSIRMALFASLLSMASSGLILLLTFLLKK